MKSSRLITPNLVIAALIASLFFDLQGVSKQPPKDEVPITTFSRCWEYSALPDLSITAASDGESAYFIDTDGKLSAVDLSSGSKVWSSDVAGEPLSNLLVTGSVVIVASKASAEKSVLRAVSKVTGVTQWSADLPSSSSAVLGSINGTVVVLSSGGLAAAFGTERGLPSWSKDVGAGVTTAPAFVGHSVLVGTDRKDVIAIRLPDGDTTVIARLDGIPTAVFSPDLESVLVGDDRGNLDLSSYRGKREWRFRNGARISSIAGYDSEYLATSHDNFLYKLTRGGNVEWKRRLSARIDSRPIIVGSSGIVATVGDGTVYVIDLTNGKIANRFETGDEGTVQAVGVKNGFAIISTKGLSYFSSEPCTAAKKKTMPDPAPSREMS